jgi:hypothetical protein
MRAKRMRRFWNHWRQLSAVRTIVDPIKRLSSLASDLVSATAVNDSALRGGTVSARRHEPT